MLNILYRKQISIKRSAGHLESGVRSISVSLIVIVTLLIKKILTLIAKEAVTSRPLAGGKGQAWDIAILDWVRQRR